jgi:competence protein ComEC
MPRGFDCDDKIPAMNRLAAVVFSCFLLLALTCFAKTRKSLDLYFIDVEGGQATLIVSPSGQSMLIDTGWPGFNGRDAGRISAAAKLAGIKQIDYVVITHFHRDHVGGAPQLAGLMKIGEFIDHGPNQEDSAVPREDYAAYEKLWPKVRHVVAKSGDSIPLKGVDVKVLTSAGNHLSAPLPGANQSNPLCATEPEAPADATENARSLGTLFTYGKFRFIDLGDLTKKKEVELVCPNNLVGTVDVYLTTHHGLEQSNARAIVQALHPRVAIMNNGAHKGGKPEAWQTIHDSPGLEDLWQLHYAVDAGKDHNVSENLIANVNENCEGAYIKLSALPDGTFTVFNSRNQYSKTYKKQ